MNPLYLTEGDVVATLPMREALILVESAAIALAERKAQNRPRQRAYLPSSVINVLVASYAGRMGHKTYTVAPKGRGASFWYTLFNENGEMLAIMEADALGQIRTGAASGLATRILARDDAHTLGIVGTGWQARSQLEACLHVRAISRVLVWGRNGDRLAAFVEAMQEKHDRHIEPATSPRELAEQSDIICTITTAHEPVLEGKWLRPGTHINAAGSNRANAQEIDVDAVERAGVVAIEDLAQAKVESGDLRAANETGAWSWEQSSLLSDIVAGHALGRTSVDQITLFESLGIGLWDVAVASYVFDQCVTEGRGTRLPFPS